jgi:hypothetical protein
VAIKNYFSSTGSWAKRAAIGAIFGAIGAMLSSCGGGGVSSTTAATPVVIPLQVLPASATVFPGVPTDFSVSGGTPPYTTFTDNNVVISAPPITGSTGSGFKFTVIAQNVNADTPVNVTVRDVVGATLQAGLTVKPTTLNNTVTITPIAPTGTGCAGLCSGGDADVTVTAILNGVTLANRAIRFSVFQGDFRFVTPGTNVLVTTITLNTDEVGVARARIQATVTAPTQSATLTTTDTQTGLVRSTNFVIAQATSGVGILSTLPSGSTTFTGAKPGVGIAAQCPSGGIVDMYIFGGTPPYTVASPLPTYLSVFPTIVTTNGGSFRVTQNGCGSSQLIVADAQNRSIETASVISVVGPAGDAPPAAVPTALTVTPTTHTLLCGQTGTSTTSGSGTFTATVTTPGVPAGSFTVTPTSGPIGSPISFTRNVGVAAASPTQILVNVVAGTITSVVTVNVPASCP